MSKEPAVTITEPAAVAALKRLYRVNGPGKLRWDFSEPGRVTAGDQTLTADDNGCLTGLTLFDVDLKNVLKLADLADSPLARLASLTTLKLDLERPADLRPLLAGLPVLAELGLQSETVKDWSFLSELPSSIKLELFSSNQDCDLTSLAGLAGLKKLTMRGSQISDLSPLAGLTALTKLALWHNQISDLSPLAGLTALKDLQLGGNQISDLSPLAILTDLTELNLWFNQISDLSPLAGLTVLTELGLWHNQLSDLTPLAGLTALQELHLGGNQISDLSPLAGLTALKDLQLSLKPDSDVSFISGLTSLIKLDLDGSQLGDLTPLSGLLALTALKIEADFFDLSVLSGLASLTKLGLKLSLVIQKETLAFLAGLPGLAELYATCDREVNLISLVDDYRRKPKRARRPAKSRS